MAKPEPPVIVFLGPTLPYSEARNLIDGIFVEPASQGDIILAAHAYRPRAMILIDGRFEDCPPVRHKEIIWAMAHGIEVIGASSMGALRAAELHQFGMIGIGLIYRWFRRWPLAPDDAVAVQSAGMELGYLPLSNSLIDLQITLSAAMRAKIITACQRQYLTRTARRMNFRDRSFDSVLSDSGLTEGEIELVKSLAIHQKAKDAVQAIAYSKNTKNLSRSPLPQKLLPFTNTFLRDMEIGGINLELLTSYR